MVMGTVVAVGDMDKVEEGSGVQGPADNCTENREETGFVALWAGKGATIGEEGDRVGEARGEG